MKFLFLFLLSLSLSPHLVSPKCSSSFMRKFTRETNRYRALHGSPPLTQNGTISSYAQEWADKQLSYGKMTHRQPCDYSENIFHHYNGSGETPSDGELAKSANRRWYKKEEKAYRPNYGQEPDFGSFSKWSHFTAMIWRETSQLGVGCATSSDGKTIFIVANYAEKGNVKGSFKENVPRPVVGSGR